jgi:CRISPR/Cas system-associated exonuclease Cas4 (RecB family)
MDTPDGGVSATDLAEYAYCPRAHWYRDHPPAGAPDRGAQRRADAGRRYHAHELGGERRRAEHGVAYWGALLLGAVLFLGAVVWIFHR